MTTIADRLFTELDRQMTEVRTIADGIATRAGFLTSATALAGGLLGARFTTIVTSGWTITALVAFGLAAFFGIGAVTPSMYIGVKASRLSAWISAPSTSAAQLTKDIFTEKLVFLERNQTLLMISRVLYYLQGLAVLVAIVTALLAAAQPAPGP